MLIYNTFTGMKVRAMTATVIVLLIFSGPLPAWSHGGKNHAGIGFSSLQAVQKATELYDRLIKMQKLDEAWETGLKTIDVSTRQTGGSREYVVRFSRVEGDPGSVYFFFNQHGEYAGSNFTGK